MKRSLSPTLLCLLALLALAACGMADQRLERTLVEIDSLMMVDADSARVLLKGMQQQMDKADEDVRMYYDLLCFKADDKAKVAHTTDTVIGKVLEYYEQSKDKRHLPEAYYYTGRALSDMGNGGRALVYFQLALLEDSTYITTFLKSRIYAQMGYVYLRNGLLDEARNMQEIAYSYSKQLGDTLAMRYSEEDIATIAAMSEQVDSDDDILRTKTIMLRQVNERVKNHALRRQNQELMNKHKNDRTSVTLAIASFAAVLLFATSLFIIIRMRRSAVKKAREAEPLTEPAKRNFYDKEVSELIAARLSAGKALRPADWTLVESRLLAAFPSFKDRLYALLNFSETEYRICMLIKIEVSPSNMAKLLSTGTSAVSQSRLRMQQKVFNGSGTAKDWDNYVLSL